MNERSFKNMPMFMTPRQKDANQARREASYNKILSVAMALFVQHGYDKTSVRMIAQAADISLGLLYNYFDNKESLFKAVILHSLSTIKGIYHGLEVMLSPVKKIESLITTSFDIVRQDPHFWRLFHRIRMQPMVMELLAEEVAEFRDFIIEKLEENLKQIGVPAPRTEARILFATVDGIISHYVYQPEIYPLDEVEAALLKKYHYNKADKQETINE